MEVSTGVVGGSMGTQVSGRMQGRVAFVTGAARGQGRSHAVRLAEEGADIIAVDLCDTIDAMPYEFPTAADLDETARQVDALDRRVFTARADVRNVDHLAEVLAKGVAMMGRLDFVIANAGIGFSPHRVDEMPESVWRDMLDVNLTGVWHTAKVAVPHIRAGGRGGSIVFTSSVAGLRGYQNCAHYVAAKHGVVGLMRSMALELAPEWIRVNSVHPGNVDTAMLHNEGGYHLFRPDIEDPTREDILPVLQSMNALPIPQVEPVDVSNALLFLLSDEARYVTGVALPVDAGFAVR